MQNEDKLAELLAGGGRVGKGSPESGVGPARGWCPRSTKARCASIAGHPAALPGLLWGHTQARAPEALLRSQAAWCWGPRSFRSPATCPWTSLMSSTDLASPCVKGMQDCPKNQPIRMRTFWGKSDVAEENSAQWHYLSQRDDRSPIHLSAPPLQPAAPAHGYPNLRRETPRLGKGSYFLALYLHPVMLFGALPSQGGKMLENPSQGAHQTLALSGDQPVHLETHV